MPVPTRLAGRERAAADVYADAAGERTEVFAEVMATRVPASATERLRSRSQTAPSREPVSPASETVVARPTAVAPAATHRGNRRLRLVLAALLAAFLAAVTYLFASGTL